MNDHHLTDAELDALINEAENTCLSTEAETHISDCTQCQTRILNLSADPNTRETIVSSITELSENSFTLKSSLSISNLDVTTSSEPNGDRFDLHTVDEMLSRVLDPATHPEMLGRLGRYDIESIIGCGGMGVVLRGFDRDLHRPVAIKMILPRLAHNGTAKQRFAREARAAAAVLHPNVIGIHGIDENKSIPWFVMPLIAGPSLQALVDENGPLPERDIVRIALQIASGLSAAHSQGLVHRDIKPANVLVDNQVNRVVITDFGLARHETEDSMTQTGFLAGTLNYMSPEQSRGEDIDGRSDLFSLGSLLYFLASGVVPFRGEGAFSVLHKLAVETHTPVQSKNPDISKTLSDVIDRLLQKSPESRFQSATELETFLEDYLAHLNQPTQNRLPRLANEPSPGNSAFNRLLIISTIATAAVAGLVSWTTWNQTKTPEYNAKNNSNLQIQAQLDREFRQSLQSNFQQVNQLDDSLSKNALMKFMHHDTELSQEIQALQSELDQLDRTIDQISPLQSR